MAKHTLKDLEAFGLNPIDMQDIINEIHRVCQYGAQTYGRCDWLTTTTPQYNLNAVERHIEEALAGTTQDVDTDEHPLAHALTRLIFARILLMSGYVIPQWDEVKK